MKPKIRPVELVKAVLIYTLASLIFNACGKKQERNTKIRERSNGGAIEEPAVEQAVTGAKNAENDDYVFLVSEATPESIINYISSQLSDTERKAIEKAGKTMTQVTVFQVERDLVVSWLDISDPDPKKHAKKEMKLVDIGTGSKERRVLSFEGTADSSKGNFSCLESECKIGVLKLGKTDGSEMTVLLVSLFRAKGEIKSANLPSADAKSYDGKIGVKHPAAVVIQNMNVHDTVINTVDVVTGKSMISLSLAYREGASFESLQLLGPLLKNSGSSQQRLQILDSTFKAESARIVKQSAGDEIWIRLSLKSEAAVRTSGETRAGGLDDDDDEPRVRRGQFVEFSLKLEPLEF